MADAALPHAHPSTRPRDHHRGRAGRVYRDRETGEELEVVGKVLPLAPSRSQLPWAVENLRFCNWCDQLAQKDLNDCPTCGRRMAPLGVLTAPSTRRCAAACTAALVALVAARGAAARRRRRLDALGDAARSRRRTSTAAAERTPARPARHDGDDATHVHVDDRHRHDRHDHRAGDRRRTTGAAPRTGDGDRHRRTARRGGTGTGGDRRHRRRRRTARRRRPAAAPAATAPAGSATFCQQNPGAC